MIIKKPSTNKKITFRKSTFHLQIFCTFASLLMAHSAIAENNSAENADEVIVTASKRNQILKDFSGSVSVIQGDAFNPGANISDLADQAPGLSVINNGPRSIAALTMRGLRMDGMSSNDFGGDGGTVASYIDNIPLQGFFVPPSISFKDLQQIEVLRGPQGTLYGNASVGGLIRYVTAKPDLVKNSFTLNASLSQTAESDDLNYSTDLTVNAPLIDNVLGVRLLVSKENNAGFIDNDYLLSGKKDDINSDETKQARATILWKPTNELSLTARYEFQKINADDRQATNESFTGDKFGASSHYLQPVKGELILSSIDAEYDFDVATLTASVNRYDYTTKTMADQTDYLLTLDNIYGWGYYSAYDKFSAFTRGDVDVIKNSGELRLVSPNNQPLRWLVGAFVSNDDLDVTIADRVPGFADVFEEKRPDDLDYIGTQAETLRERSVYAEVAYDFIPEWEVTLGARHFKYKDELTACTLLFPAAVEYQGNNYPLNCSSGDDDQSGNLGKFSTKYKFNESQNIYLTIAEGFRRGGANFLPVEIQHNRSYKPDRLVNYDLGTHSDFLDGKLQFSGSLFYMEWKKIQVASSFVEDEKGYGVTVNAGTARTKGIELETIAQLGSAWNLRLSYSLNDAVLNENVESISGGTENAYSGDRLPGSPKHEWNLGLNYKTLIKTATFTAGVSYSYSSDITTAFNKEFTDYAHIDGYSMVNAKANVTLHNWRFGLFVNNLGNTRAITGIRTATLYGEQGQFDYITRPRTMGASLQYQF